MQENGTLEGLSRHVHCESTSADEGIVLSSEKIGENSNEGRYKEIEGICGTKSGTQTEGEGNQTPHEDTSSSAPDTRQGNNDQMPMQSVTRLSQSSKLPGRTEIHDDRTDKPRGGGEVLETLFPSPLGGEEVGINQVFSAQNHGIDQVEDLELVEPTQRRQSARKKGITAARLGKTKSSGTKPRNKFDVPYKITEYPQLGTSGQSTTNTETDLFMSPIVTATENYNSSQPAIGKKSLRNARSSATVGKNSQSGNEMDGKNKRNVLNSESIDQNTGKPSTVDKGLNGSEAEEEKPRLRRQQGLSQRLGGRCRKEKHAN